MNRSIKMVLWVLVIGALLVSIILTFIALGLKSPVPWLLIVPLLIIPFLISRGEKQYYAVWKDEYSVGVKSLDDDHRKLLNLINNLQTAVHYQTGKDFEKEALEEVVAYTKYHFEREEKMLEEAGYADLEAHKNTHQKMISEVGGFLKEYEKNGHQVIEEIASYLRTWLIKHINGTDQEYSLLLQEKGVS